MARDTNGPGPSRPWRVRRWWGLQPFTHRHEDGVARVMNEARPGRVIAVIRKAESA